jgi:hypothetical protein
LNQAGDKKHFPFVIFHFSFVIDSRIRLAPGQHLRVDVKGFLAAQAILEISSNGK